MPEQALMIECSLPIRNFYWAADRFRPSLEAAGPADLAPMLATLRGQFSLVWRTREGMPILARDPLGSNKLFFAIRATGEVVAANYLIDLVNRGVPFEAVYSVPAGHSVAIDPDERVLSVRPYFRVSAPERAGQLAPTLVAREIRRHLEIWFSRLAEQFPGRPVCVTLSGGLDSSLIAALATMYFPDVTAYTYCFTEADGRISEDAAAARQVAEFLDIPVCVVHAGPDDVLGAVEDAVCYGQDWREFNAHCAIVNEILARAIAADARRRNSAAPLVLTGDLGNELVADYAPFSYAGRNVYSLPRIAPAHLRTALLRGLDAGDREVGIFNHHGLDVVQPYGFVIDQYLQLPASSIGGEHSKQTLVREIAGDVLPRLVFERQKARAQIGDAVGPGGILTTLMRAGRDGRWLREAFARRFGVKQEESLNGFIRIGRYRFPSEFPAGRHSSDGSHRRSHRPDARTFHPESVSNSSR